MAGNYLKRPEQRVVFKSSALNDDMIPDLIRALYLQHLVERVPDDGIYKSGGNVLDRRALFLGLPHLGVHEYRASRTQIYGRTGPLSTGYELIHIHPEGLSEVLQERAAAR